MTRAGSCPKAAPLREKVILSQRPMLSVVLGKKKKNARAHAGRQAKLRLDGSKLGQKKRGSDW